MFHGRWKMPLYDTAKTGLKYSKARIEPDYNPCLRETDGLIYPVEREIKKGGYNVHAEPREQALFNCK